MKRLLIWMRVLAIAVVVVSFTGCAGWQIFSHLSPLDKAKTVSIQMATWYENTGNNVLSAYRTGSPEAKAIIKVSVIPPLLHFGDVLKTYNDAVSVWDKTQVKPLNIDSIVADLQNMTKDIINALNRAKGK